MTETTSHFHKLFEDFQGKRIMIIGDMMIDAYLWGMVDRISPEAPVPVVSVRRRESRLGGAANVALNVASLGGLPLLFGLRGEDERGREMIRLMNQNGLDSRGIIPSSTRLTTVKFRIIGNQTQMLRVDEEQDSPPTIEEQQALLSHILPVLENRQADAIVFEDYDKGVMDEFLISEVVSLANRQGIPVAVDPKKRNFFYYRNVDLFKPNLKEMREGLKLDSKLDDLSEIKTAAARLQEMLQAGTVLCTLSDRGVYFRHQPKQNDQTEEALIPAHLRSIADVSGAGDTVIAVAALCLAAKASPLVMARLCNLAGGLVCEYPGVVPVNKEQLQAESYKLSYKLLATSYKLEAES